MISMAKSIHVRTAAFFLVWSFAFSGVGFAGRPARPTTGDLSSIHIDNFGRVNLSYYRGAEPDDAEYANLAAFGIRTIVDLRGDDTDLGDQRLVERTGMKYTHLPMTTHQPPSLAMIQAFLHVVTDPANQPVYVHCVGGRHRTGVMTAVYRMSQEGWTAAQAFKEMKQYKFGSDFLHPEFKRFVYSYQPNHAVLAVPDSGGTR
jgi:tyrosine-protein phosphatase SIW14